MLQLVFVLNFKRLLLGKISKEQESYKTISNSECIIEYYQACFGVVEITVKQNGCKTTKREF